jgi:PAS domain S-box-containing protein
MPGDDTHAVVFADAEGVIHHWSSGATRLFGHAAANTVGRLLDVMIPPPFREKHWAAFRHAMSSGQAKNSGGRTNIPVLCADGEVRSFPGTFVFLTDAHGVGIGAIAILGEPVGGEQMWGDVLPRVGRRS